MTALISSPNLFVVQTESSIYYLLQFWLYIILNPSKKNSGNRQQILVESSEYFQKLYGQLLFSKIPLEIILFQHIIFSINFFKMAKNFC